MAPKVTNTPKHNSGKEGGNCRKEYDKQQASQGGK
jgi:hypothetical protein